MDTETTVAGVNLRIAELTGGPGDMVFCRPVMVHCAAANRGAWPRFVRVKTRVLTREGREGCEGCELRDRIERPPA